MYSKLMHIHHDKIPNKLWNEGLNSDGHQFHQYQQNELSYLILTELTEQSYLILTELIKHKIKTTTYNIGNPGTGLGQSQKCGGFKPVNEIPITSPLMFLEQALGLHEDITNNKTDDNEVWVAK